MSIRVALNHRTCYQYDRLVTLLPQVVRLRPAPHCRTPIESYSIKILPKGHFLNWQQDPQGNYLARLVFPEKTREFSVEVDLVAEMTVINPFDFFLEPSAENWPFAYDPSLARELKPFLATQPIGPQLRTFLASVSRETATVSNFLVALNQRLQHEIEYVIRLEPGVQTCEETLGLKHGSCRDSAWLLVQILRNLGLAARFASGYLIQLRADVKSLDGPSGPQTDFTDLHAWTEVYLPGAGWVGLDPTSGLLAGEGHIPLACTPDPSSAAPVTGAVEPCESHFQHAMTVTRIHEDPRTTLPYTDDQWRQIEALGHRIDGVLESSAVRLTMGGEPTFVSIDDMQGDEWNTAALGPTKWRLAGDLLTRLRKRFGAGALLHSGMGKWYPGEPLPRWSLGCYWRKDGVPVWNDPELFADEDASNVHGEAEARSFVTALAERLGVAADFVQPAYEDVWHYLARERRLPVNVDPLKSNLKDGLERDRLARIFEQGLGKVVGYVLPLEPVASDHGSGWRSGAWFLRQGRLFLAPGDSPMGLRLPLDSLPWVAPKDDDGPLDVDPFAPRKPLPSIAALDRSRDPPDDSNGYAAVGGKVRQLIRAATGREPMVGIGGYGENALSEQTWPDTHAPIAETPARAAGATPQMHRSAKGLVRTALCVESRQGMLNVFMPPVRLLNDYLALVSAVEETAKRLHVRVVVEGYPPPHDHRLDHIKITPDPGVIEVNIHPAQNWAELVRNTTGLYEDARRSRLATEKFMLDGKHTGTGGGNHVVLGGKTPADSPFLRRPDLLRSLIGYWHNHPSLSYLFSGTFIGPTSQAPRVDEARHDNLYELEIAFQQIPEQGECPPWLVDRVFRHLLVDVTGNTHRSEFCIDKLFSPDTASGRLGLVEFRAFEMPPHPRMSLTQQLLLRALVARFWTIPYRQPLARWGTTLHDRFLLPHFAAEDFRDVIDELRMAGFALEHEWFEPHFEFRFPQIGEISQRSIRLELRHAIEPWNVLGEEPVGGATARYVDSSVERLQVKVSGMTDARHVVACNGGRVPLHPTGRSGEFVAGVRYRAWQPPNCLHPTIAVHAPLVFDILDTWSERSIGGCAWHVAHSGGRNFEDYPVNANAAESRRAARFFPFGHTPGAMAAPPAECSRDFPLTLDLRRNN